MSIVGWLTDPLLTLHGAAAYALVGALVLAEAAVFIGFVVPGETAVILGGVLAYRHSVSFTLMLVVVVLAAIVGDSIGYEVGRRYGNRILNLAVFANRQQAIDRGRRGLRDKGGRMVLLGRFTAFLRAVTPGLAGTVRLPYPRFLAWNALGALVWGAGITTLGYVAGGSYDTLERYAGQASNALLAFVAIAVLIWLKHHRRLHAGHAHETPREAQPEPVDTP